jgi:hypothetical protein
MQREVKEDEEIIKEKDQHFHRTDGQNGMWETLTRFVIFCEDDIVLSFTLTLSLLRAKCNVDTISSGEHRKERTINVG